MLVDSEVKRIAEWIADNREEVIRRAEGHLAEVIQTYPEHLEKFVEVEEYYSSTSIDVFEVVGTNHPNYMGRFWAEMLRVGVRMSNINLPLLKRNPGYYFEKTPKKPPMYYAEVDGKLYIYGDGNHRTSIAKVLFSYTGHRELHGVTLHRFFVNHRKIRLIEELKKVARAKGIFLEIEMERRRVRREDREGFHRDYFQIDVKVVGKSGKSLVIKTDEELRLLINELRNLNWFRKLFWKGRFSEIWE
jgi:hypothetical protein